MADEKSIVKMNKMIHKKTGASFLVVYVIYVSLVYTDSKKTASCLLPRHTIFCNFWKAIKMPTCTHTGQYGREIYSEDADSTSRMRSQSQLRNDKYIMMQYTNWINSTPSQQ